MTGYSGNVTVSMAHGPAGASLAGGTTVAVAQGVGTFSGLTLDRAATGDSLELTAADVGQATTGSFQVVPAAASQLVIVAQPPGLVVAGQTFGFAVAAEDRVRQRRHVLQRNGDRDAREWPRGRDARGHHHIDGRERTRDLPGSGDGHRRRR